MRVHVVLWLAFAAMLGSRNGVVRAADEAPSSAPSPASTHPLPVAAVDEPILPPLPATHPGLTTQPSVVGGEFRFPGNPHVAHEKRRGVVKPFLGRALTMGDLEAARLALTKHLVEK